MRGKRGFARASRVKIDLPSEAAALLEFDIACIHCTSHPVVNVKRIKYFLAADGPENSNVTTDGAAHIRGFCSRIKINRTPILGRNDCTFACAFILVAIYARYIVRDYRYDRSNRYLSEYMRGFQMTVGKVGFSRLHAGLSSSLRRDVGSRGLNVFIVPFSDN